MVALALDVALLAGLAVVDKAKGWSIVDLPWWAWLLLAAPALVLMTLLLAAPARRVESRPGAQHGHRAARAAGRLRRGGRRRARRRARDQQHDSLSAGDLLAHGTVVWLTNIITFGLLFWLLDEGGPLLRAERGRSDPDFGFPQDAVPRAGWSPRLSDYLYVALTNAIAFSPTDTMPLTRRAKGLLAAESLISYVVVILVVARAVNVLGTSS